MGISESNIKLLASQRMQDTDDGGGRMTGTEIVSGEENNIFADVSDLDRTYGRVSLRKIFAGVLTGDTDTYYGANLIIADEPDDPNVSCLLFSTRNWSDERKDASARVEAYVAEGARSEMKLLGNHIEGQRMVLCYQRPAAALPEIGEVYALVEEVGDTVVATQFVRVTKVEHELVEYVDGTGTFSQRQISMEISDPLRRNFPGGEPARASSYQPPTKIHRTSAVDASRYYGIARLAEPAALGDLAITVDSIYGQLVPNTQAETPVTDVQAGGGTVLTLSAGARSVDLPQVSHTAMVEISINNRGYNYVFQCQPLPGPRTLTVSYRAQGKWYTVRDEDGTGVLTGAGSGTVTYATGAVALTLAALPDADTALLYAWGSPIHYTVRTGEVDVEPPVIRHTTEQPIKPGTLVMTWLAGGQEMTATAAVNGVISGDASGRVIHSLGEIAIIPNALPDPNTQIQFDYQTITTRGHQVLNSPVDGVVVQYLPSPPKPGTVGLSWYSSRNDVLGPSRYYAVHDDGEGHLLDYRGTVAGTIDYSTGAFSVQTTHTYTLHGYGKDSPFWGPGTRVEGAVGLLLFSYAEDDSPLTTHTESTPVPPLVVELTPLLTDATVPGSVAFGLAGRTYIDRDGTLYYDTGVDFAQTGYPAGTIDYSTGACTITDWASGSSVVSVASLLTTFGQWTAHEMMFRTPGAPLRPGSVSISATTEYGELLTATTDLSGVVTGDGVAGTVEQDTGVVQLRFGRRVLDTELTPEEKAEYWYNPADVDQDGMIWQPVRVIPNTVRYHCVVYVYLPLSADVLGLDPVRLPMDGRVPIMRLGDVVVIHHTAEHTGVTPAAGAVLDLGRPRLSRMRVWDATGALVPREHYTPDLDAGQLTWADPLDLSGYTGPYRVDHTVEDMALVTDVDISGRLGLNRPISHTFPPGDTRVSSALLIQDLRARATEPFGQQTWTGEWSDGLIGDATPAQYNATLWPIEVTNAGATQERWRVAFKSSTTFDVVGETVGVIAMGDTTTECAPLNPATGQPYFRIRAEGWGGGWSAGNQLRFNTYAANYPVWVVRTVQPGPSGIEPDRIELYLRGNIDA